MSMVGMEEHPAMKFESLASVAFSVMLALVVAPAAGLIGGLAWYAIGGGGQSALVFFLISVPVFACTIWKTHGFFRKSLGRVGATLPEPVYSGVVLGLVGASVLGGGILAGILILGHTRPDSLNTSNIPLALGLGFLMFLVVGFAVGSWRLWRNHREPRVPPR
jgi:hypothetical protein